jgi:hypothetical protein
MTCALYDRRMVTVDAKPEAVAFDPKQTAVLVVDMQNDFGASDSNVR